MSNYASEGSKWLKDYSARVNKARNKSNGNKWLVPVIFTIITGGFGGMMIANGALEDPQKAGGVKILGVVACVMLLLSVVLIAKGKKKVASGRTEDNLNALLTSADEVKAFDKQMSEKPVFFVDNAGVHGVFATKDYLVYKFSDMGDETYEFARLREIASIHYQGIKTAGKWSYIFDLRNADDKVLLNGTMDDEGRMTALREGLADAIADLQFIEDKAQ